MVVSVKSMVENNKKAHFVRYANGFLIYETECGFEFPIPISDLGHSTLNKEEKALILMRYINAHLKTIAKSE